MKPLREQTKEELLGQICYFQAKIEANDGRLTSGSSYELDYFLDMVEAINAELEFRNEEIRQRRHPC